MATDSELMHASLEYLAEHDIDIASPLDRSFLARRDVDTSIYYDGNLTAMPYMVTKIVEMMLFFAEDNPRSKELANYDVPFHRHIGVTMPMYQAYFEELMKVLAQELAPVWDPATSAAWQRQIDAMLRVIGQHIDQPAIA